MKKILALHPSVELYGADRIFVKVLSIIEKSQKFDSIDVLLPKKGELSVLLTDSIINIDLKYNMNMPIAVRSLFGIRNLLRFFLNAVQFLLFLITNRHKYKCIYLNTLSLAGCAFLARLAGYSNIISHSHEIVSHYGILPKLLINLCVLSSHRVVCVSDAVKNDMLSSLIIKQKHKFIVVHNGIESQKYIPIEKSSKFQILLLGRIMHEKGQWFLLDSLKKMSDQILNQISVKIVGSPPPYRNHLLNELESYIHQLKMDNIVEIAHFLKNPAEIIQMSHICVVPSIMPDPFPTTVLEAMAFGRAVIATNNGGAKEIIKHGETGFLVRPNDTEGLAMIINALVSDVGLIERIGKKAFSFFNDYLTVEMFEKRFMRVISCE